MSDDYTKIRELLLHGKADEVVAWGEAAIPNLIETSKDGDASVRMFAVEALGKIGNASATPALIEALKDRDAEVRGNAAFALGKIWCANRGNAEIVKAVPALIEALNDRDWDVRNWAAVALASITEKSGIDLRAVEKALRGYVDSVKGDSVETREAKGEARRQYMKIAKAAGRCAGEKHSLTGNGIILEGSFKPPSDKKMYRQGQARAIA